MTQIKPRIAVLTMDNFKLVTQGGNEALFDKLAEEFVQAEMTGKTIYVRYAPNFLQRLQISKERLEAEPEIHEILMQDEAWEDR